jgi:hypothetical protein
MDTLLLLELTDNLNEALTQLAIAKDDTLATLDAIDLVNDALVALGGEFIASPNDYTPLLQGIISGEINVFTDQTKLDELEQVDDSADADLLKNAAIAAAKQVLIGLGEEVV